MALLLSDSFLTNDELEEALPRLPYTEIHRSISTINKKAGKRIIKSKHGFGSYIGDDANTLRVEGNLVRYKTLSLNALTGWVYLPNSNPVSLTLTETQLLRIVMKHERGAYEVLHTGLKSYIGNSVPRAINHHIKRINRKLRPLGYECKNIYSWCYGIREVQSPINNVLLKQTF